ncbi:small G signaling modulator 2, partial [Brachionus plicatilis]
MRKQILCRAFYGWLAYHRHLKTITTHLVDLVNSEKDMLDQESDGEDTENELDNEGNRINIGEYYILNKLKLDQKLWLKWTDNENKVNKLARNKEYFYKIVYLNGIENDLRKQVWPFLLDHYTIDMTLEERQMKDMSNCELYCKLIEEWKPFEELINTKDQKKLAASLNVKTQNAESSSETTDRKNSTSMSKNETPAFDMNKKSSTKKSLFGFSILKQKPKPLVTTESLKNEAKSLEKSKILLRKDSSLSNDVFVENESAFSFSLSKFSAKSLLNKLMSRNSEDIDTVSCSILGQKKELTDEECRAFAVEIVNNILNKIQSDWEVFSQDEGKKEDDDSVETFKTGSVYTDTRNFLSNATSFSIDESFHDIDA